MQSYTIQCGDFRVSGDTVTRNPTIIFWETHVTRQGQWKVMNNIIGTSYHKGKKPIKLIWMKNCIMFGALNDIKYE
jgi:hypothetical protein